MRRIRLREAHRAGVREIVTASVASTDWDAALALSARSKNAQRAPIVYAALGLHPYAVGFEPRENDAQLAALEDRLAQGLRPVAIGECGLDFRKGSTMRLAPAEEQVRVLDAQLSIARAYDLPVILHCVRAHGRLFDMLAAHGQAPSILHAYSGSAEMAQRFATRGDYLSFAAPVMLNDAKRQHEAVRVTPEAALLIETDSPDQCPAHCPPPNRPSYLPQIAAAVASLRGCSVETIAAQSRANARRAYRIEEDADR